MGISRTWCQSGQFVLQCENSWCYSLDGVHEFIHVICLPINDLVVCLPGRVSDLF